MFASRFHPIFTAASLVLAVTTDDDVFWASPSEGSIYRSGDTLTASWKPQANLTSGSPSFRLCDESDVCGTTVWPAMRTSKDGFKEASLIMPDVTSGATFHLWMGDDIGKAWNSPNFTLDPLWSSYAAFSFSSFSTPGDAPFQEPLTSDGGSPEMVFEGNESPESESKLPLADSASITESSALSEWDKTDLSPVPGEDREQYRHRLASSLQSSLSEPLSSTPGPLASANAPVAPPMSQVHLPMLSDPSATPLTPHANLASSSQSNSFPVAALAVPLSFALTIAVVAAALVIYNRRKPIHDSVETEAAGHAIHHNMKLLEARNTSFFSSSSASSSGPSTPTQNADAEKATVLGRLTRWAPLAPRANRHGDVAERAPHDERDGHVGVDGLAALPSQKFDEIPLSPRIPPPLHVRNLSSEEMSRFTTRTDISASPVGTSPISRTDGLYNAVTKALGPRS